MSFHRTLDRMTFYVGAASAVLAVVGFLVGGVWTGFGALVGGAFGIANWLLLRWVGGQIVKANDRGKAVWGIILTVKLTAGLGVVWGILSTGWVDPTGFAIGMGGLVLGALAGAFHAAAVGELDLVDADHEGS